MTKPHNQELASLASKADGGAISRREFMTRAAALGAGGVLASSLLSNAAYAATPKSGGKFRVGLGHGSTTDSLDPATFENQFMSVLNYTKNNHLAEVTAAGLEPELAESWEASSDAKIWRFKIRQGRRVPQRQDPRRQRRRGLHQPPSARGLEVSRQGAAEASGGRQGGRRRYRRDHVGRRKRRFPLHHQRLSHRYPARER